jgi:heat shock protein HslJ
MIFKATTVKDSISHWHRLLAALAILTVILSGCQSQLPPTVNPEPTLTSASPEKPAAASPTEPAATSPTEPAAASPTEPAAASLASELAGKEWVLIAYGDALNPVIVEPGTRPTGVFGPDGAFSGNGSCNNLIGSFETDGQSISFGPVASTMMACETGMDQETAYLAALENAISYEITRAGAPFVERLRITYDSGKVYSEQLVFDAALPLVDTLWVLTAYGNPEDPTPSEPGIITTAVFGADGTLSGSTGCNRYTTPYTALDGTLSVALPASTLMACASGMDQEYAFLTALQNVESYQITGGSLEITYQDGTGTLLFSASHLQLENVRWSLARIDGQPLPDGVQASLTFTPGAEAQDNQVNGSGGCNNFFGTYNVEGNTLSFPSPLGATLMMCDDPVMQVEQSFLAGLESAQSYDIALQGLTIWADSGLLSFDADRYALEGPVWTLTGLGTLDSLRAPVEGTGFTAVFERQPGMPSGQISGGTGCNEYTATYYANLQELKVNLPQTTQQTCSDAMTEEEQAFFLGLNAGWDYRILGNELQITYGVNQALIFQGAYP